MVIGTRLSREQDVMLELHGRAERAEADAARLRKALEHVRDNVAPDKEGIFYSPTPYLTELTFDICEAALSAPADEQGAEHWLERHDAKVRAQERERCAIIAEATRFRGPYSEEGGEYYVAIPSWSKDTIAAAIREGANDV